MTIGALRVHISINKKCSIYFSEKHPESSQYLGIGFITDFLSKVVLIPLDFVLVI